METKIRRWVVYGSPWFTSTMKHAATVSVLEPDIAVNGHIPLELLQNKHLDIKALYKRVFKELVAHRKFGKSKGQTPANLYRRTGHGGLIR